MKQINERRKWAIYFALTFSMSFLFLGVYYVDKNKDSDALIIQNDNYYSKFEFKINKINRYGEIGGSSEDNVVGGLIAPISASQETDYIYLNDFEDNYSDWNSNQYIKLSTLHYEGEKSLSFKPLKSSNYCEVSLNKSFEINSNFTSDIVFYVYMIKEPSNGNIRFNFKVSWTDDENDHYVIPFSVVIAESEPYLSLNQSEIVIRQQIRRHLWTGILIQNIRERLLENNYTSVTDRNLLISDINFVIDGKSRYPFYLDHFLIQKTPFNPTNLWFYGKYPCTDYQIQINYEIKVNTSAIISLEQIQIKFVIYRLLKNEEMEIDYSILEYVMFENLTFELDQSSEYDQKSEGVYLGVLHGFPYSNWWGNNLYYSFNASISVSAPLINGKFAQDSVNKVLDNQDFAIIWKKVIQVS